EGTIRRGGPNPTNAGTLAFDIRFTEPVTGFALDDIDLVRSGVSGTLEDFSGAGAAYSVRLTGVAGDGEIGISVASNRCYDLTGKTNAALAYTAYHVDNTAPAAGRVTSVTNISPVHVHYAGAADSGCGLEAVQLWYKKERCGEWRDSGLRQPDGDGMFAFRPTDGSGMYYFALRAEDRAGNLSAPIEGNGDIKVFCPEIINLVLPAEGGTLESFTGAYPGFDAWKLTDERADDPSYVWWSEAHPGPQEFIYSFESNRMARVTELVLYNCRAAFASREFEVWSSADGETYTFELAGTLESGTGPQVFPAGEFYARTLKLIVTDGYNPAFWELAEFEAIGYFIDLPPSCSIGRGDPNPSNADAVAFTIRFSEPVYGFELSDIAVSGNGVSGTLGGFCGEGSAYSVSLTGLSGNGTIGISVPFNACTDAAGKTNHPAALVSYTIDRTAPAAGHVVSAENMSPVTLAYEGAHDAGTGLKAVTLWYRKGSGGVWTASGLTAGGTAGTFDFLPPDGAGTYYFAVRAEDNAGNVSAPIQGDGDLSLRCEEIVNLVLPGNGGALTAFTSEYKGMEAAHLTDEGLGSKSEIWWSQAYPGPQSFDYSFNSGQVARVCQVVLYNYGQAFSCKAFELWANVDDTNYTCVLTGELEAGPGPQLFNVGDVPAKRLKLVVTDGYNPSYWELAEFEVYGYLSWPFVTTSGDRSQADDPYYLADGTTNTVWVGNADGSPWRINMDLGEAKRLNDLRFIFDEAPWAAGMAVVGSLDGYTWFDMTTAAWPVDVRYVHAEFWADGPADPPAIREIVWEE
ncbi:MAG: hypothetical protein JW951_08385, partial [Lentisphaerae bacterium]|nr:hypothetical protein [Lentisphaerota bacterium]